jgi:hypothetical protein
MYVCMYHHTGRSFLSDSAMSGTQPRTKLKGESYGICERQIYIYIYYIHNTLVEAETLQYVQMRGRIGFCLQHNQIVYTG